MGVGVSDACVLVLCAGMRGRVVRLMGISWRGLWGLCLGMRRPVEDICFGWRCGCGGFGNEAGVVGVR